MIGEVQGENTLKIIIIENSNFKTDLPLSETHSNSQPLRH